MAIMSVFGKNFKKFSSPVLPRPKGLKLVYVHAESVRGCKNYY